MHDMGSSMGGLGSYMKLINKYDMYQGRFICDFTLGVHGEGFDYIFFYAQGGLESLVKNGYEWLYRCPKPTFCRALTDNDRGSKFHIKSGSWLAADIFSKITVNVSYKGVQGLPELPVFGLRFIMPTLADKYRYEGLSGETYPDCMAGAEKTIQLRF